MSAGGRWPKVKDACEGDEGVPEMMKALEGHSESASVEQAHAICLNSAFVLNLFWLGFGSFLFFMLLPSSRNIARQLLFHSTRWHHAAAPIVPLNSVTEQDVAHFAKFLAPTSILSTLPPTSLSVDDIAQYNNDWMGKYHGKSTTVLKPKTTQEVSKIVKWCWERRIGIVPQGGNTGLVGGSVPLHDELIVSLANMSKVRSFDPVSGSYLLFIRK